VSIIDYLRQLKFIVDSTSRVLLEPFIQINKLVSETNNLLFKLNVS
jgi:hypothetical protein